MHGWSAQALDCTVSADRPGLACHQCGAAVSAPPYALRGGQCSCESCLLKDKELRAAEDASETAYRALAEALASALDVRERETGLHSKRVACHTLVLARRFSSDPAHLRQIYWGALLHDIGKIGIPDAILLKPGPLDEHESAVMRTHPEIGYSILKDISFMTEAAQIVLCHEERFDGKGYPRGLAGSAISLGARLFAVIDTLDAMTSDRPYRSGLPFDSAKAEIRRCSGEQFDPQALAAFLAEETVLREMVAAKCGAELPSLEPPRAK
jgi:putative nucleotidyltransferase with HDIG domain